MGKVQDIVYHHSRLENFVMPLLEENYNAILLVY